MKKINTKALAAGIVAGLLFGFAVIKATASVDKITWCHTEPNGNQQTLELPQQALENAGHVNASGNPLHAGDHAGACITVTSTLTPTIDATGTPTSGASATLTPTFELTPTLTVTPTLQPTPGVSEQSWTNIRTQEGTVFGVQK